MGLDIILAILLPVFLFEITLGGLIVVVSVAIMAEEREQRIRESLQEPEYGQRSLAA